MAEKLLDDVLNRLAAFEPNGFPVISLYLNAQANEHGRDSFDSFLRKELPARAKTFADKSSERESFDKDAERIDRYLKEELQPSANGVVIFACSGADLFEAIQLEAPVQEHRLYVYDQPHLYGLALLSDEYPRYAAVVADTNRARIFVFGLGMTLRKQEVANQKTRSTSQGGWSQARYQRHISNYHLQHVKEVVSELDRIVREDRIDQILIGGDEIVLPIFREQLPKHLAEKVIDVLRLDIRTPEHQVLQATFDRLREEDAASDIEKANRMFAQARAGGLAVAGLKGTLAALERGQVDELLLSASLEQLYPDEEEIREPQAMAAGAGAETATRTVLLPDELVTRAAQTGATVTFIENADLLAPAGGIGAFLRYRI